MKIFKKYTKWEDVKVRRASNGTNYLLQMRTREDGKKQFKNRRIDADGTPYLLFHEDNSKIAEVILTKTL